jgi:hypothetical protein
MNSGSVIHQVLAMGEDLKRGLRSIKETVVFDEEEITELCGAEIYVAPASGRA